MLKEVVSLPIREESRTDPWWRPFVLLNPFRKHAYPNKFFLKTELLPPKMLIIRLVLKQVASNTISAFNLSKEGVPRYSLKVKEESSGWNCSKKPPTLSCRAPCFVLPRVARHPSLALGTASLTSFGTALRDVIPRHASAEGPPRLTPRGDKKRLGATV